MQNYKIPFDTKFEDKVFGGRLTLKQVLFYAPSLILILVLANSTSIRDKVVNGQMVLNGPVVTIIILIAVVLAIIASLLIFVTIEGDSLDKYLISSIKYSFRNKTIKFYN